MSAVAGGASSLFWRRCRRRRCLRGRRGPPTKNGLFWLLVLILLSSGGSLAQLPTTTTPATAAAAPTPPPAGTVAQLWSWWPRSGRAPPPGAAPAFACLADAFSGPPRDRSVYSQVGEDGIIEAIFACIGEQDKRYVELGTENCLQCTSRYLREMKGWSGLLLDGTNSNPSINLRAAFMRSDNIAHLLAQHGAPRPRFDHLTVDIDLNTFHVLRAILHAGYRPRSVAAEYNRNFAPDQAYTALDLPGDHWRGSCYFGASALALERLMRAFGYTLVAFDEVGVNVFFVHDGELVSTAAAAQASAAAAAGGGGAAAAQAQAPPVPAQHTFAALTANRSRPAWQALMADCQHTAWARVAPSAYLAGAGHYRALRPAVLVHERAGANGTSRVFREVESAAALLMRRHRRWAAAGGGGVSGAAGVSPDAASGGAGIGNGSSGGSSNATSSSGGSSNNATAATLSSGSGSPQRDSYGEDDYGEDGGVGDDGIGATGNGTNATSPANRLD